MTDTKPSDVLAEIRARAEAHRQQMEADPDYRERVEREQAEEVRVRAQSARRERLDRLQRRGVPKRLWDSLLEPKETDALRVAREWASKRSPLFLVLAGGIGVGKTFAAAAAVAESDGGRFVKAIEIARAGQFNEEFWDKVHYAGLLAIDDLGTEPLDEKGWALAGLHALFDRRYDDARPTVITTNLPLDAFMARYGTDGGRLRDRLRECGRWVNLAGESMRRAP